MVLARKLMIGATEIASLGVFVAMIWVWAVLASAPGV